MWRGDAFRRKARRDDAREAEHAGADRTVHRSEQRAEHHARHQRRRWAAGQRGIAGAIERVRDRKPVEQQAHGHVERQRLQQIVFKQIDEPARQRPQRGNLDCAGHDTQCSAECRHGNQDHRGGQAGGNDADADQPKQRKPDPIHQVSSVSRGRKISTSDWPMTEAAITQSAILIRK